MSSTDLESIIPKSNADTSDSSDEYEVVSDSSSDEEPVKPSKCKKHKKCKKDKNKSPVRTKKTKLPSRGATVGSDQLPPLQTTDPAKHVLEAPKPIIVKQAIDNDFNKNFQIDLSKETQQGIAYQQPQQLQQEGFEESFDGPFYKHKYFPLIVVIIVSLACIIGTWWYFKRKFQTGYDPIKATLTGGDGDDSNDDEVEKKSLNELTGSANVSKLPPSYEDSFDRNDDSDGEKVIKDLKSTPKRDSKSASTSTKGPQRDSHGRFVKK